MAQNSHLGNPYKQKRIKKEIKPCVGCGTLGFLMSALGKEPEASGCESELSRVHIASETLSQTKIFFELCFWKTKWIDITDFRFIPCNSIQWSIQPKLTLLFIYICKIILMGGSRLSGGASMRPPCPGQPTPDQREQKTWAWWCRSVTPATWHTEEG